MNEAADRAEALTGAVVGQAIRGISWFSLNNETLAEAIEAAIAVAVRKGTEALAWCYYSCRVAGQEVAESLYSDSASKPAALSIHLKSPGSK